MRCPHCRTALSRPLKLCPSCGKLFEPPFAEVLSAVAGLRAELAALKNGQERFQTGLAAAAGQIDALDALFDAGFGPKTPAAGPDPAHPAVQASPPQASALPAEPLGPDTPLAPQAADPSHDTSFEAWFLAEEPETARTAAQASDAAPVLPPPVGQDAGEAADFAFAALPTTATPAERPLSAVPTASPMGLELKLGQRWLLVVGIVVMVFGVGYFLQYSFARGWIGPLGRTAMAYLWGGAFLAAGEAFRRRGYAGYGLSLVGGGVAVLYFATYAAFHLYGLVGQYPAFALMCLTTALAIGLALRRDSQILAALGLLGGFLTPLLLSTGEDNQVGLMTYIAILNLGGLAAACSRRWAKAQGLCVLGTYLLYAVWHYAHYAPGKLGLSLFFLNLFLLQHTLVAVIEDLRETNPAEARGAFIPLFAAWFCFAYGQLMLHGPLPWERVALLALAYAILFAALAMVLFAKGRDRQPAFPLLTANAAVFLGLALALYFSKQWITTLWILEAAGLAWIGLRWQRRELAGLAHLLLLTGIGKFLFLDLSTTFAFSQGRGKGVAVFFDSKTGAATLASAYTHLLADRMVCMAVILAATVFFALAFKPRAADGALVAKDKAVGRYYWIALHILLFVFLNRECLLFFEDYLPAAKAAGLSVLWVLYSLWLMILGFSRRLRLARLASLSLFAVTLAKVFAVDLSEFSTPYRIGSFLLLGLALVGASFLYHRYRPKLPGLAESEDTERPS